MADEPPTDDQTNDRADVPNDATPAGDDHVDELPDDLDAAGFVGPYVFPNNNRRRVPGYLYLATAAACVAVWALVDDSPYVNDGFLFAAVLLGVIGVYQLVSGWNLDVDEQDALVAASRTVGFPIGHASAQMGWRGLLSRPTWRILLYSAENPPTRRGLVLVDGVDGEVIQHFVEDNPEDWSDLDTGDSADIDSDSATGDISTGDSDHADLGSATDATDTGGSDDADSGSGTGGTDDADSGTDPT